MAFKLIPKGEIRSIKKKPPHVAITNRGVLCISTAAVEQLVRDHTYEYAFLLWDEEAKLIAIRPTRRKDNQAHRITYSARSGDGKIAAKSFCEIIGYDYSRSRSFIAQWNEADREFRIDLKNEMFKSVKGTRGPRPVGLRGDVRDTELTSWYTKTEVCGRLRISKRSLERLAHDGEIEKRYRRVGGRMAEPVYNPSHVDARLKRKKPGATM